MKQIVMLFAAFILLSSCDDLTVFTDYDKEADFTKYKTYGYLPWDENNSKLVNEFTKRKLYENIALQLAEFGYKHTFNVNEADMAINLHVIVEQQQGTKAYTNYYGTGGYGYGYHYNNFGYGYGTMATTTYQNYTIHKGSMIIDIFDNASKDLIWQGGAAGTINENPSNRERGIKLLMKRLFQNFPAERINK